MSEEQPTTAAQAPPPPPPAEEPWAARFGMIRPRHGRYLAGVCASIGRATNTDPLLWRVLIGVLAIFGVGIVIYLAGWLLTPAEGDSASPIEALFGRGSSSTSTVLTLILGVIAVVLLGAITDSWVVAIIAAVGLVIAAMALNPKAVQQRQQQAPPPPPSPYQPAYQSTYQQAYQPTYQSSAPPAPPSGYQPPFAPRGPFEPPTLPVPPVPPLPPKPPKVKREPSRLGRLIFGLILIAAGLLGIADMAGASVPGATYVAAILGVIGVGLIVGAWFGRSRGFILIGLVVALLLPAVASSDTGPNLAERGRGGRVLWNPPTIGQVSETYEHRFGEAVLDLSRVDFAGQDQKIYADISFGEMIIILPPNVDTTVIADVSLGGADVFNNQLDGVGEDRTNTDLGEDGEGGGKLTIELKVRFGNAEVTR